MGECENHLRLQMDHRGEEDRNAGWWWWTGFTAGGGGGRLAADPPGRTSYS